MITQPKTAPLLPAISHAAIEFRAYELWGRDNQNGAVLDSMYYWNQALQELTPDVQMAIQAELPTHIICKPGDTFHSFFYYLVEDLQWRHGDPKLFAKANLDERGIYWLSATLVRADYNFDLNVPDQLEALLVSLETLAAQQRRYIRARQTAEAKLAAITA